MRSPVTSVLHRKGALPPVCRTPEEANSRREAWSLRPIRKDEEIVLGTHWAPTGQINPGTHSSKPV